MTKTSSNSQAPDLFAIAHQAMIDAGFVPDRSNSITEELHAVVSRPQKTPDPSVRDLRELLWSSIDDRKSRDLD